MKDIFEYYPNGRIKHKIRYYDDGNKWLERYYDEEGRYHNDSGPDFQGWYENGMLWGKAYCVHGKFHNINSSANIYFHENGKIEVKDYSLHGYWVTKLQWMNRIKNI